MPEASRELLQIALAEQKKALAWPRVGIILTEKVGFERGTPRANERSIKTKPPKVSNDERPKPGKTDNMKLDGKLKRLMAVSALAVLAVAGCKGGSGSDTGAAATTGDGTNAMGTNAMTMTTNVTDAATNSATTNAAQ